MSHWVLQSFMLICWVSSVPKCPVPRVSICKGFNYFHQMNQFSKVNCVHSWYALLHCLFDTEYTHFFTCLTKKRVGIFFSRDSRLIFFVLSETSDVFGGTEVGATSRVATNLENLGNSGNWKFVQKVKEKSGNLSRKWSSQGNVREFKSLYLSNMSFHIYSR